MMQTSTTANTSPHPCDILSPSRNGLDNQNNYKENNSPDKDLIPASTFAIALQGYINESEE